MAKTQEELKQLKNEYESLNNKLKELTEAELMEVTGGVNSPFVIVDNEKIYDYHIYPNNDQNFKTKF